MLANTNYAQQGRLAAIKPHAKTFAYQCLWKITWLFSPQRVNYCVCVYMCVHAIGCLCVGDRLVWGVWPWYLMVF